MSKALHLPRICNGIYPEREVKSKSALDRYGEKFIEMFRHFSRADRHFSKSLEAIKTYSEKIADFSDQQLQDDSHNLRYLLRRDGLRENWVARSFAIIRESSGRVLAMRHHDCQLQGGWVLLKGMVAEMETGEGKTLTAILPAATAALAGVPVHVVTVNDYLTERDAQTMLAVYKMLGLTVGTIVSGMNPQERQQAYRCDITYCTNKELVFDYLKDRITLKNRTGELGLVAEKIYEERSRVGRLLLRGLCFAIVDEADSILIDEARTPLIISGAAGNGDEERVIFQALDLADQLEEKRHFKIHGRERQIKLTDRGIALLEELVEPLAGIWSGKLRREELVTQALSARHLFIRDEHYLVQDDKIVIIDEYTGRSMADRSWNRGLHQLIEAKESCTLTLPREPIARISYQRFFCRYLHMAGMSGTVKEVAKELWSVYKLRVTRVPTHKAIRRVYQGDVVYATADDKWQALLERVRQLYQERRPVLIGSRTLAASEIIHQQLLKAGLPHQLLNARQDAEEADIIARAGDTAAITIATNMAGRGTDIHLGDGVAELGGLHVILTEKHESQRIDRQLIGRCARQGDPGSCQVMLSLDDELVSSRQDNARWRLLAAGNIRGFFRGNQFSLAVFKQAQQEMERVHYKMRLELHRMDGQLGDLLSFSGQLE